MPVFMMVRVPGIQILNSGACILAPLTEKPNRPLNFIAIIDMKILALTLFVLSTAAIAGETAIEQVTKRAVTFNQWYVQQIIHESNPLAAGSEIEQYVMPQTLKTLRHAAQENDDYDGDYFLKVQDFDDLDWAENIRVDAVIYDPVCTTVYVTFGKARKQVADCFIHDNGQWRIQSVTDIPTPQP